MNRCLQQVIILTLFCIVASARGFAYSDSTSLPPSLIKKLNQFRQKDELDFWIYERMMYVEQAPAARIGFLMRSQQEAWRSYKTYYERMAWFDLLSVQGYYLLQTGNIIASINAYETALAFYESYPMPDADIIETVLKPLGNNYTRLADYTTALFIHQKTMALAQKANNKDLIAATYSNMAICSRSQDDLSTAAAYCRAGIRSASPHSAIYGLLLSTHADVLTAQLKYDSAEAVCTLALKELQQHQQDAITVYWYAGALQVAARVALQKQQFGKATGYAKQALQLFQHHSPHTRQREKAKVQVLLADIGLQCGRARESLAHYQQALQLMMPAWQPASIQDVPPDNLLYSENTLVDALCGKATAFVQLQQPDVALQEYITAFEATGRLRKEFFYTESKLKEITVNRARVESAIKLAYNLWLTSSNKKFLEQLLLISEMSRAQVLLDERQLRLETATHSKADTLLRHAKQLQQAILYYQHELLSAKNKENLITLLQQAEYDLSLLNKKIKQTVASDSGTNTVSSGSIANILQHIPPQVTMLEFVAGSDSSFIIELNNQGIRSVQVIDAGKALHGNILQFMQRWFAAGPSAMMNDPRNFYKECYDLYHVIFKGRVWANNRHYVLIPDGMFNYLPFDALVTDPAYTNNFGQWPYLIKQASLSQAYSLATWFTQQTAQYRSAAFTGFFVSKGEHTQQVALSIDEEYQSLSRKIAGRYYSNATATWNAFNNITGSTGILHISSHGVSSAADAAPYLQLYDKPFYLFDLRYKHFAPALVVLSACKTADGLLLEGEGLNSIGRGFTAAGAGGVISGLWNVNDKTAIDLMQHFYEQLQQQSNIAMALHNAKKQWLRQEDKNAMLQLPYYWAGFIYSGHLQQLSVPAVQTGRWYYWLLMLVLVPAVWYIVYLRKKRTAGAKPRPASFPKI